MSFVRWRVDAAYFMRCDVVPCRRRVEYSFSSPVSGVPKNGIYIIGGDLWRVLE